VRWAPDVLAPEPTRCRCLKARFLAETDGMGGLARNWPSAPHLLLPTTEAQEGPRMPFLQKKGSDFFRSSLAAPEATPSAGGHSQVDQGIDISRPTGFMFCAGRPVRLPAHLRFACRCNRFCRKLPSRLKWTCPAPPRRARSLLAQSPTQPKRPPSGALARAQAPAVGLEKSVGNCPLSGAVGMPCAGETPLGR